MNIKYYLGKLIRKVLLFSTLKDCKLHSTSKIGVLCSLYKVTIDAWSYVGDNTNISYTDIGRFSSISSNCSIGGGEHPLSWVSTSPVFNSHKSILGKSFVKNSFMPYTKTTIGNDVWIGSHVCIKSGVKISDGAVIGMGAVVTKNVGPYEVWGGNPARMIKYRFDKDYIDFLLEYKWWEKDKEELKNIGFSFSDVEKFKEVVSQEK